jgi:hypothetical protein
MVIVGGFEAIASHVKKVAKTSADPVVSMSNGVFLIRQSGKYHLALAEIL